MTHTFVARVLAGVTGLILLLAALQADVAAPPSKLHALAPGAAFHVYGGQDVCNPCSFPG